MDTLGSMGCVCTHWRRPVIERCGNPNHVQNIVKKIGKDSWKVRKIDLTISKMPAPRSEHDKFWAWWALGIMSKNMLERVWWCRCFKMESWNQTIWCPMNYSKRRRHVCVGAVASHMSPWSVVGKGRCCCWPMLRLQEGRDVDQP